MLDADGHHGQDDRKIHIFGLPYGLSKKTFFETIPKRWKGVFAGYYKRDGIAWGTVEFETKARRDRFLKDLPETRDDFIFNTKLELMEYIRGMKFKNPPGNGDSLAEKIQKKASKVSPSAPKQVAASAEAAKVKKGFSFANAVKAAPSARPPPPQQQPKVSPEPHPAPTPNVVQEQQEEEVYYEESSVATVVEDHYHIANNAFSGRSRHSSANLSPPSVASSSPSSTSASVCARRVAKLQSVTSDLETWLRDAFAAALGKETGPAQAAALNFLSLARKVVVSSGYLSQDGAEGAAIALRDFVHYNGLGIARGVTDAISEFFADQYYPQMRQSAARLGLTDPREVRKACRDLEGHAETAGRLGAAGVVSPEQVAAVTMALDSREGEQEKEELRGRVQELESLLNLARKEIVGRSLEMDRAMQERDRVIEEERNKVRNLEEQLRKALQEKQEAEDKEAAASAAAAAVLSAAEEEVDEGRCSMSPPMTSPQKSSVAQEFVRIQSEEDDGETFEFKTCVGGKLSLDAVQAIYPGTSALMYRSGGKGIKKVISPVLGLFDPPEDSDDEDQQQHGKGGMWGQRPYTAVAPKNTPAAANNVVPSGVAPAQQQQQQQPHPQQQQQQQLDMMALTQYYSHLFQMQNPHRQQQQVSAPAMAGGIPATYQGPIPR